MNVKAQLKNAIAQGILSFSSDPIEIVVQETPPDKLGDYGTPVAFQLAKQLKQNPAQLAALLAQKIPLPPGISKVEAVGPYLNFFVDIPTYISTVVQNPPEMKSQGSKVIIEHTSVNPNKELHVGHLRNVVLGDTLARIYRALGYNVEVQNYIDDTGRQAADSLFAKRHYPEIWDKNTKYDHWLGELYVRLHQDLQDEGFKTQVEPQIRQVMHQLERGELRSEIEKVLEAQLETCYALGARYDLLTWESDIVGSGFLDQAMKILEESPSCSKPQEGKYAGCFVMDTSEFLPGLEDPILVLIRSDGTATYTAKDIAQQFWKFGLFGGLTYAPFGQTSREQPLYTTHPMGVSLPFAHANRVINVIDSRQAHPQAVVKAALAIAGHKKESENSVHLSYNTVLLEGKTISGRKGITVSVDEVITEAKARAQAELFKRGLLDKLDHPDQVAEQLGLGALRFAMLKSEPGRQIDFRWDSAIALEGDTAPYVQYSAARAKSILRKASEAHLDPQQADYNSLSILELKVIKEVAKFEEILEHCVRDNTPHHLVQYALDLANAFNAYFNHRDEQGKPDTKVIDASLPKGLQCARLVVVEKAYLTLIKVLDTLGIQVPKRM